MKNPTVVLAEDETGIRQMMAVVLKMENVDVLAEARDGVEALKLCRKLKPTFLLTDMRLPLVDAAGMQLRLREEGLPVPVMIYTGGLSDAVLAATLNARPAVMVHKTDALEDFRLGVRAAAAGSTFYSQRISRVRGLQQVAEELAALSDGEVEMLKLIAGSKTTKQAAEILGISEKTGANRREQLMAKLNLHDAQALTRFAVKHGLVEEGG